MCLLPVPPPLCLSLSSFYQVMRSFHWYNRGLQMVGRITTLIDIIYRAGEERQRPAGRERTEDRRLLSSRFGSLSGRRLTFRQGGGEEGQIMVIRILSGSSWFAFPSLPCFSSCLLEDEIIHFYVCTRGFLLGFQKEGSSLLTGVVFYQNCFQWNGGRWLDRIRWLVSREL